MRRNEAQTLLDEMVDIHRQIAVKEMEIAQLQDRLNGIREGILSAFMEDAVPNSVPEDVPPVTDMEEVKKVTGRGGKPKRIFMRNTETGVEKEFPSKTRAAQFLDITQQYLAKILKDGGTFKGWWITEVADTPGA